MFEGVNFDIELTLKKIQVHIYWSLGIYLNLTLTDINRWTELPRVQVNCEESGGYAQGHGEAKLLVGCSSQPHAMLLMFLLGYSRGAYYDLKIGILLGCSGAGRYSRLSARLPYLLGCSDAWD